MPTYDYLCPDCDFAFEEFQQMSEPLLKKCPKCGKRKLRRLFGTGAGIIFKGSGFYETDYKKKTGGESKKKDEGESSSSSKNESKTESKPDTKPDSKPASKPAEKKGSKKKD